MKTQALGILLFIDGCHLIIFLGHINSYIPSFLYFNVGKNISKYFTNVWKIFGKLSMDYWVRNYSDLSPPLPNVKRQPKWVILTVMKPLLRICTISSSNWKHSPILIWNSLFHLLISPSHCHFWWITILLQKNILQNTAAYLSLLISQEGAEIQIWACFTYN